MRLTRDPVGALDHLHRRYGPVVDVGSGRLRYVYLFGPEANEIILASQADRFRWRDAFLPLAVVDGDTALVVSDGDDHRRRRRIVQPAFHRRRIATYLDVMIEETAQVLDGWAVGTTIDAYAEFRAAILRIVLRCLFGDDLRVHDAELAAHLEVAIAYVNRTPLRRFDIDLPGTAYRKALRARGAADDIVFAAIEHRRRAGEHDGDDVLSWLIEAQDDDTGSGLSDQEVRDQVVSLVAAGYDTTAAALGWAVAELAGDPERWERARQEVAAASGDGLTLEALGRMPFVQGIVAETLRLHSPAIFSGQRAVADVEVAGYVVPAGRMVLYSPAVTHRLAEHWPDPERFLPERWVAGEPAHHEPVPYAYVPFGGGARRCLGFAFASQELAAMVALLVSRTRIVAAFDRLPPGTGIAAMAPKGGVPVRVTEVVPVRA